MSIMRRESVGSFLPILRQKRLFVATTRFVASVRLSVRWTQCLFFSEMVRPLRFVCIGGIAGCIQLSMLDLLAWLGWQAVIANSVAFLISAQVNFFLNSLVTWSDRQSGTLVNKTLLPRWLAFHYSIALTGLFNIGVFLVTRPVLPTLLASALGIGGAAILNFFIFNRFVFRKIVVAPFAESKI